MKTDVIVLGGTGMLGSMVVDVLARDPGLTVRATARDARLAQAYGKRAPEVTWASLDALTDDESAITAVIAGAAWIVNAIGLTKPCIHDDNPVEVERAIRVNSLFPHLLGMAAGRSGARVLQIATDCVYSGKTGGYNEDARHDAEDAYGKTKSLGEANLPALHHLRTSIIGPEPKEHKFLIDWFVGQGAGAQVKGFTNHRWNGVTTLHFARLCQGVIRQQLELPRMQHVLAGDTPTKCDMLRVFARSFNRPDIGITAVEAPYRVDRNLSTKNDALNRRLWQAAGYAQPPTVADMIDEVSRFDYRFRSVNK